MDALRNSDLELEQRFSEEIATHISSLNINSDGACQTFEAVMKDVFGRGVSWGRIRALFAFAGEMCVQCAEKGDLFSTDCIVEALTCFLDTNLRVWISTHGGWDHFVELHGKEAVAQRKQLEERFFMFLGGVTLLTGFSAGVLVGWKCL
ncbi:bcl-2-like protein 1 [Amia ocellicauda]|uniref:bcl-2-like protein 1 n=1 Tax=Amia ocellicauda TaxID=2972642 RepID=UPI003463F3B2